MGRMTENSVHARAVRRGTLLIALVFFGGCGRNSPTCVPVSGTVTLDGDKVPGPGYIYFTSVSAGKGGASRPGTAEFDADGRYRAKTFVAGDGLLPGKYALRVDCWKTVPNLEGKPSVSFLPQKYQNPPTSNLELTVAADASPITFDIRLTSK
jgi:hypothetical protein